ncbi:MAG: hypothetical protein D6797_00995 [Bdellovibrio sp.]|nr:MAG: hypothetical protein D6797_00995 [Bdellovibrio sp.]
MRVTIFILLVFIPLTSFSALRFKEVFYFSERSNFSDSHYRNQRPPYYFPGNFAKEQRVEPKRWGEGEAELMEEALSELLSLPQLQKMFLFLARKGPVALKRFAEYPGRVPGGLGRMNQGDKKIGSVKMWAAEQPSFYVGVTDDFFKYMGHLDREKQVKVAKYIGLHELSHLYDYRMRFSFRDQQFLRATGWKWAWFLRRWENQYVPEEKRRALMKKVEEGEMSLRDLDRIVREQYGLPSFYSVTNPKETFAEVLAAYVLVPEAKDFLRPEIMDFLDGILNN